MKPLNVIRSVKQNKEKELLALEGVTGVDIGPKIVDGKRTSETAIRVYVEKKKKTVARAQSIPKTIDGIKTDVIEAKFELHQRLAVEELKPHADTGTYSPLVGGISIGPCSAVDGFVFVGTLGCMVKDRSTGDMFMLSNYHVMAEKWAVGETQCQPSRPDGGSCPSDVVGTLVRSVLSDKVDGAVARITARPHQCKIHEIGSVRGKALAAVDMNVRKRGRTTELTHGIVSSIDATVNVPYDDGVHTLTNQILIDVDTAKSSEFGLGGDSGSVVVDEDNKVVGLYYAGTSDGSLGVANPIDAVLDELDVDLCVDRILKDIRSEIWEKHWIIENIPGWKDRFKEVAYDKPPLIEYLENPWDRIVNPPDYRRPWFNGFSSFEDRIQKLEQSLTAGTSETEFSPSGPARRCIDFASASPGSRPNPLSEQGARFEVYDRVGRPAANARIATIGRLVGLDAGVLTTVSHEPCDSIEITLVHFNPARASIEAYDSRGAIVDRAAMRVGEGVDETIRLSGRGREIARVEIIAPQNEVLIRRYCHCGLIKPPKFEKPEIKEWKEIKEKPEFKELKEKEIKEKPEPKELKEKEFKEKPEPKELKEKELKEKPEPKELKEKELKEKDFKEKPEPKEIFEGGDQKRLLEGGGNKGLLESPPSPYGEQTPESASLEARLAALEAKLGTPHFIGQHLRPDLRHGALKYE